MGGDWNGRIDYDFKASNLTANGSFLLFVRFLKSLRFERVVKAHLEVKRSWRRHSTVELLTCLISMMVLGVERISATVTVLLRTQPFCRCSDWRDSPLRGPSIAF